MTTHELLLKKLEEAINLASDLSTIETDYYAQVVEALMEAEGYLARVNCKEKEIDYDQR